MKRISLNQPLVSVIIPVYNREQLVGETLESLSSQSYQNWECILVDDGSTDNTLEVMQEFSKSDPRIKVFERLRSPKGAPTCRNIGMQVASGDYLMFLDSDDTLAHYCLEQRVKFMMSHDSLDYSIWNVQNIYQNGGSEIWGDLSQKDDLKSFLIGKGWSISSSFFKTGFISSFVWDEEACSWQDWEFHIRVITTSKNYEKLIHSDPDVFIDRTPKTRISTSNRSSDRIDCLFRLFKRVEKNLIERNREGYLKYLKYPWYSFLEIAAIELSRNDLKQFLNSFKMSGVYSSVANSKCTLYYLSLQNFLKRNGFKNLQFIPYRFMKLYGRKHWL